MPRFTVRIELHDATWEHYQQLYENLAKMGFTDILMTDKGRVRMPPAEYNYEADVTKEEVLAKAKSAAARVVQSYAVLVTVSGGRTWHGLDRA